MAIPKKPVLIQHPLTVNFDHPLARGLVDIWLLNDGGGAVAASKIHPVNKGILNVPASTLHPPDENWGRRMSLGAAGGTGPEVYVLSNNSLLGLQKGTISFYFTPNETFTSASGRHDIVSKYLSFWFIINYPANDGKISLVLNSGTPNVLTTTTSWTVGVKYHIAGTFDGANIKIYVNGLLQATTASSAAANDNSYSLEMGAASTAGNRTNCQLSDVRIWRRALSNSEILSVYTNPKEIFATSSLPVGYFVPNTTVTNNSFQSGGSNITATNNYFQSGGARISDIYSGAIAGQARLTNSYFENQTGLSRIAAQSSGSQPGLSRVSNSYQTYGSGMGRISKTENSYTSGKASVLNSNRYNQSGQGRVSNSYVHLQSGIGNIRGTFSYNQSGISNIANGVSVWTSGKSSIATAQYIGQSGKSSIFNAVYQYQSGVSRISRVENSYISGRSAVVNTSQYPITGTSRLSNIYYPTQSGAANILKSFGYFESGVSRITNAYNRYASGVASVSTVRHPIPQSGKAAILNSLNIHQSGVSNILKNFTVNQSGVARVNNAYYVEQSGKAAVLKSLSSLSSGVSRLKTTSMVYTSGKSRITPFGYQASPWIDNAFGKRLKIDIDNSDVTGENLLNFPVLVRLNAQVNFADFEANGVDIRFADSGNLNYLDYEIEKWESGNSFIWVKVPEIFTSEGSCHFWMYYNRPGAIDASNKTGVWSNNFQAVYHFAETGATQYLDSTRNAYDSDSIGSSVVKSSSGIGNAPFFDGVLNIGAIDSYISFPNYEANGPLNFGWRLSDWTIEAFVKPSGVGQSRVSTGGGALTGLHPIISKGTSEGEVTSQNIQFILGVNSHDRTVGSDWENQTNSQNNPLTGTTVLSTDNSTFYHVAATEKSGDFTKLYVSGVLEAYKAITGYANTGGLQKMTIGAGSRANAPLLSGNFAGTIDEVRVSKIARSDSWVFNTAKSLESSYLAFNSPETVSIGYRSISGISSISNNHFNYTSGYSRIFGTENSYRSGLSRIEVFSNKFQNSKAFLILSGSLSLRLYHQSGVSHIIQSTSTMTPAPIAIIFTFKNGYTVL